MAADVSVFKSFSAIPAQDWDFCALESETVKNPFLSHRFLVALEKSGSATSQTGWTPLPVLISSPEATAALPLYLKVHSYGEYVFDQGWAQAWNDVRPYYPKLVVSVPFTPVTGQRFLSSSLQRWNELAGLIENWTEEENLSSAHILFPDLQQAQFLAERGWLIRQGIQFHWTHLAGWQNYDDFLETMSSRKRKNIRKERELARQGIEIHVLTGSELGSEHWEAMWQFYQHTGARKWGAPYLTRNFFEIASKTLSEDVLMVLAKSEGRWIAGALNFIGSDTLFGRYWGALEEKPFLHFELCYHQAIEWALQHGFRRVEAGAQGEHKIARGYLPTRTWSAHWFRPGAFRDLLEHFLVKEKKSLDEYLASSEALGPFHRPEDRGLEPPFA